jgi:hypothetical protein
MVGINVLNAGLSVEEKLIFVRNVVQICGRCRMTKEEALKAWEKMYSEIDKENHLFVGTINPQMVEWAIKALRGNKDE